MPSIKPGKLIVFSGVSGVGKNSILKKLFTNKDLNLVYSISMTTRKKRINEIENVDYFFVSKEKFEQAIKEHQFLEWATFCDNYYGTPKSFVEEQIKLGKNVILEIEVQGAMNILEQIPEALSICVLPPSIEELEKRLKNRNTEDIETIKKRLKTAEKELTFKNKYRYNVINDNLDQAVAEIEKIIKSEN